jgi:excisionase family DNA binding protein
MPSDATRPRGRLLTVPEVAARLRQDKATIYSKIANETIPCLQLGGPKSGLQVDEAELDAWLRSGQGLGSAFSPPPRSACK